MSERANEKAESNFEAGVRQAIEWLRADYIYGEGPEWRERGCEWIADRLAEHRVNAAWEHRPADARRGQIEQWGVARNVAADGFVNPGQVGHAAHQADAERKATLFGGVPVSRVVTDWRPLVPPPPEASAGVGEGVGGPAHQLLGNVCICGDWWAQCGNDIPAQWADHVRTPPTATPDQAGTSAEEQADG